MKKTYGTLSHICFDKSKTFEGIVPKEGRLNKLGLKIITSMKFSITFLFV